MDINCSTTVGDHDSSMTMTVQGYNVVLLFANKPNPQVAAQVRQALLGSYFPAK